MSDYNIFTSESVSEGHPDKLADQISDAVLDAILTDDPHARRGGQALELIEWRPVRTPIRQQNADEHGRLESRVAGGH